MTENALKCKYNGGGITIGFTIDKDQYFQVDPLIALIVLEAFKLYADGYTIKQVMDFLNNKGIQSYRNKPLRIDCVKRLLKNRRYIGEYKYRDVVQENGVPAIVPKDLFDRVSERMDKNKKASARHKAKEQLYLLTTKLFCGKCGAFMVGESGTSRNKTFHQYYKCVNVKNKKGCDKKSVKKDFIENIVINETINFLTNDDVIINLIDMLYEFQKKENTNIPQLKKQRLETEKAIDNILNAIQQGVFTSSTKQRLEELEEVKSDLEITLINEEIKKPILTKEQIAFWFDKLRKTDISNYEQKQRLVDTFINAIYLYDDKIILTFNYKDGSKTISLDDIKSSDLGTIGAPKNDKDAASVKLAASTISRLFYGPKLYRPYFTSDELIRSYLLYKSRAIIEKNTGPTILQIVEERLPFNEGSIIVKKFANPTVKVTIIVINVTKALPRKSSKGFSMFGLFLKNQYAIDKNIYGMVIATFVIRVSLSKKASAFSPPKDTRSIIAMTTNPCIHIAY